jgi:hypothetical protein
MAGSPQVPAALPLPVPPPPGEGTRRATVYQAFDKGTSTSAKAVASRPPLCEGGTGGICLAYGVGAPPTPSTAEASGFTMSRSPQPTLWRFPHRERSLPLRQHGYRLLHLHAVDDLLHTCGDDPVAGGEAGDNLHPVSNLSPDLYQPQPCDAILRNRPDRGKGSALDYCS